MAANKEQTIDQKHLAWAIDKRAEIQHTLLALHDCIAHHPASKSSFEYQHTLDHLIGAAFSLWRAVFLADVYRDYVTVQESQKKFLAKVLADNAITFADDKANNHWTVGYYLENAKLRLERSVHFSDHYHHTSLTAKLMPFLRLQGFNGKELTRYEWESAHYVLRELLLVICPDSAAAPSQPELPHRAEDV
jgi:hypothetical protein